MASKRLRDAVGRIDPDRVVSAALEAALGEVGEAEPRRKKRHPGRVLAAGAALATAAAVGQRRMPGMARLPLRMGLQRLGDMTHVGELADALHDRLAGYDDSDEELDVDDEEAFDDADDLPDDAVEEDFDDEDGDDLDDLDDEDDEGFDDDPEGDDGPRGEGEGEEPEDEGDDDLEDDEVPEDEKDLSPEGEEDDPAPEEDDEEVAARGVRLGVSPTANGHHARDRAPELFEALRTPRRRAPVMRRGSSRIDPAATPPEPDLETVRGNTTTRRRRPRAAQSAEEA